MLGSALLMWLPTIVAFALTVLVLGAVRLRDALHRRGGSDEDAGSDDGPGGSRRPPRPPPLPTGPVSWAEFERQFAAYAERVGQRKAGRDGVGAAPDDGPGAAPPRDARS
jgi:hypothetical protein